MADLEDKKVSQLESGTVTSNSVFLDSGNGVSTKVGSQDIANFVGKTHVFSDLNTTSKRLVGAINEVAGSAGKSNLADMDDVNIDDQTLEDGQGLVYDETNDKWVNGTVSGGASVVQKTMAEYTALPSADKMNGTIYKITDKALIYCLDEEYHAVKEITSADYALLSSAEKNNGTLYIITDEETTADDIPYSSGVSVADKLDNVPTFDTLTTSDNNKLLGVSVSGSDISVGAVNPLAYSEGVLTMDNTYIDTTEINNWCRKGNIVEFHLTAKVKSNFTVNNRFAYGLPTPAKTGRMLGISTGNPDKIFRFNLNANGELTHAYSTAVPVANDVIELCGVYICT